MKTKLEIKAILLGACTTALLFFAIIGIIVTLKFIFNIPMS